MLKFYFPKRVFKYELKIMGRSFRFFPYEEPKTEEELLLYSKVQELEIAMIQGFLFYGPPGTGKTSFARKIAMDLNADFLSISSDQILNMWIGSSERAISQLFNTIKTHASKNKTTPIVLFFDEFDSIGKSRENMSSIEPSAIRNIVNCFLQNFDEIRAYKNVILCLATNFPDSLDQALVRGGRIDKKIEFLNADSKQKTKFIELIFHKKNIRCEEDLIKFIAQETNDMSFADIETKINNARWNAVLEESDILKTEHFNFKKNKNNSTPSYIT